MLRAIAERGSWRGEATQARKDGMPFPVEVSSMVLHDESGQITGYVSVNRDITGRKRAEETLRRSEERYRALFENMMDGFAYCRMYFDDKNRPVDFVYLTVNTAFERLTGLRNAVGHRVTDVIPGIKEAHPELFEIYGRVAMAGQPERFEVYFKPLAKWLSIAVYSPEEGYFVAVFDDITERKRAEEALRESEGRFRLLYEKAPLGYQSLDAAGCFIDVNQAWLDTLGYSREEVIGRWFGDFFAPHEVEAFKQRFPKFKATGETQVEVEMVRKDGAHATIAIVGRIAYDEHGGFKQTHCILTDITERKKAEEALRESRARLARLSRNLVEAQEGERRRIARELHDEVGQSLTALTISLEGVSQLALDGVIRGKIAETQELTKNLIAEVNALSVELRPRVLDDLGLIPGLLSLFNRFSTQTGVEIDFKHTGMERKRLAPEIEISAYRIIQEALTNVVRHAGVKTASVRLQVEGDVLWIQVQDEGKGFDLQQAMNAEDSMGLLNMMERAEQVGGHLAIQAAPGEGTIINCRLPLAGNHVERRESERDEDRPGR